MTNQIKVHFRRRFAEWALAVALALWGFIVLNSPGLFEMPNYRGMTAVAEQHTWAIVAMVIGIVRIIFLSINGAWRQSAHIRAVGAALSACVWGAILGAYFSLDYWVPNLATIGALLALDIYSLWFAVEDAKVSDIAAKESRL